MRYQLTIAEENIVRRLVSAFKGEIHQLCFWGYGDKDSIAFPDDIKAERIPATIDQLKAIAEHELIEIGSFNSAGGTTVTVAPSAAIAVRNNFGLSKRSRVLRAIYDCVDGKVGHFSTSDKIVKLTGLSSDEILAMGKVLHDEGCITASSQANPEGGHGYMLQGKGSIEIENPETLQSAGIFIAGDNYGAVQTGDGATARIATRISQTPDSILADLSMLRQQLHELNETDRALGAVIDDVITAIQAGREAEPSKLSKLVEFGGKLIDVAQKLAPLLESIKG
jgi:hypothetical protein